jgi:hypothetical protein
MIGRLVGRCLIAGFLVFSSQFANAQIPDGEALPAATVAAFLDNPSQLLAQFPAAGPSMTKQVRDLVVTDKSTLSSLITLLRLAGPDQQTAIATGLAQVAKAYAQTDPAFANQVQVAVAASGIPDVIKAYASIAGDTGTAATGGGGGAAGGGGPSGIGAPTGGSNGSTFIAQPSSTANTSGNLLSGGGAGGGGFSDVSPI